MPAIRLSAVGRPRGWCASADANPEGVRIRLDNDADLALWVEIVLSEKVLRDLLVQVEAIRADPSEVLP